MKKLSKKEQLKTLESYEDHLEQLRRDDPNYDYEEDFQKVLENTKMKIHDLERYTHPSYLNSDYNNNICDLEAKCKYTYKGPVYFRGNIIGYTTESTTVTGSPSNNYNKKQAANNIRFKVCRKFNHMNDAACTIEKSKLEMEFIL